MCSPAPDVGSLSDEALVRRSDELERASRAIDAEQGRCLAEIDRRALHRNDGHLSAAAWVAHRHRIPTGSAEARVRTALALQEMPKVGQALSRGEISTAAADALARTREASPAAFEEAEAELVDRARSLSHRDLRGELDRWRREVDAQRAALDEEERLARRGFTPVVTLDGMVRTSGELDPENGQCVLTALRAKVDVWSRRPGEDPRTPAQRRADALGEICREWLDLADRPTLGGERPHVVVTMDLAALEARAGGSASLEDAGPITPEAARRLACDARVTRVITDARSVPLEVGRATRVVSPALRRALAVRDGGCIWPGCDRPPGWCDSHHVKHWADGGETGLENTALLCRPHHRVTHHGFRIEFVDGRPEVRRPDGTPLEGRSPPVAVAS